MHPKCVNDATLKLTQCSFLEHGCQWWEKQVCQGSLFSREHLFIICED